MIPGARRVGLADPGPLDREAAEMIGLAERIARPEVAWRENQATGGSWYPDSSWDARSPPTSGRPRSVDGVGVEA